MSVFVTGGAGYVISHVVLELLEAGEEPIVLDDLSTGFREAVPGVVNFIRGDVGDEKLFTQVIAEHRVDAIIHLAGAAYRMAGLLLEEFEGPRYLRIAHVQRLMAEGFSRLTCGTVAVWPASRGRKLPSENQ